MDLSELLRFMAVTMPMTVLLYVRYSKKKEEKNKRKTISTGVDKWTPEEKKLKFILQKIANGEMTFYHETKNQNEFFADSLEFRVNIQMKLDYINGKVTIGEKEKVVFSFSQHMKNKRNQIINSELYSRFYGENRMLYETAVHALIEYDWENCQKVKLEMGIEFERIDDVSDQMDRIKEKFTILASHEEELDFESKHNINTLMNKDMPRLVESFLELNEEERKTQKESITAMLREIERKLDEYLENFSDGKLHDLEVAKKILEKRLGIEK